MREDIRIREQPRRDGRTADGTDHMAVSGVVIPPLRSKLPASIGIIAIRRDVRLGAQRRTA